MRIEDFPESNSLHKSSTGKADDVPSWEGLTPGPFSDQDETHIICWKLDPLEVQELIRTGRLWLWFYSGVPYHALTITNPFTKLPFDPGKG